MKGTTRFVFVFVFVFRTRLIIGFIRGVFASREISKSTEKEILVDRKIVVPKLISSNNASLSKRYRRILDSFPKGVLLVEVEKWTLATTLNDQLSLSPKTELLVDKFLTNVTRTKMTTETKRKRKRKKKRNIIEKNNIDIVFSSLFDCEPRDGRVIGNDDSFVAITICDELSVHGTIRIGEEVFYLEPLSNGTHVLWKSLLRTNETNETNETKGKVTYSEYVIDETSKEKKFERPTYVIPNNFNYNYDYNSINAIISGYNKYDEEDDDDHGDEIHSIERKGIVRPRRSPTNDHYYDLNNDVIDLTDIDRTIISYDNDLTIDKFIINERSRRIDRFFHAKSSQEQRSESSQTESRTKKSPNRWLKIAVAADHSVVEFHGARVQRYIMTLFNIVSAIYKDRTLEANMNLVIVRMILYTENKDGMIVRGNARKSLENVNRWNGQFLATSGKSHDVAVWLTRHDLGGPSGYAPVSGACDPARSCALNRDEGLTSAFIIAHEVAHVMGLTHDGDENAGNFCGDEASTGSVMAPMVAATFHRFHWSSCSKREFHRRSRKWTCLLNQPNNQDTTRSKATVDRETFTFTMDEQCRMEFGEGYSLCKSIDRTERCSHLWCGHSNSTEICKTKNGPPIEGTPCDTDKRCANGYCEMIDRDRFELGPMIIHNDETIIVDGWSNWSPWGECSRSCGRGVQFRTRRCNLVTSSSSSSSSSSSEYERFDCNGGEDEEFKICDNSACNDRTDTRSERCGRTKDSVILSSLSSSGRDETLLGHAYEDEKLNCQLTCRDRKTGEIYRTEERVVDGTPCNYGSSNICVRGKCISRGCDGTINSTKMIDDCGKCNGRNFNCEQVETNRRRKLGREMRRVIAIPANANNAMVRLTFYNLPSEYANEISITVRDGRRRRNDFSKLTTLDRGRGEILVVEGAAFRGEKKGDNRYEISTRGLLLSNIVIAVGIPNVEASRRGIFVTTNARFSLHRDEKKLASTSYSWVRGSWGACSASCGGGIREKIIACKNEKTGQIAPDFECMYGKRRRRRRKPAREIEICNSFRCEYEWIVARWEECSRSCGAKGTKQRRITCVRVTTNSREISRDENRHAFVARNMVPPERCGTPPKREIECNRVPCQGYRLVTDWSTCSSSCGRGTRSRSARCEPFDVNETLFECDRPFVEIEQRACRTKLSCPFVCEFDISEYCSLSLFKRYCEIPQFRKRCCASCST